jgi:hypothetical protein
MSLRSSGLRSIRHCEIVGWAKQQVREARPRQLRVPTIVSPERMVGTARSAPLPTLRGLTYSRIRYHAAGHQPVPDEQHHQRADGGGDEAGALVGAVMADGLADPVGQKRAGDAEAPWSG